MSKIHLRHYDPWSLIVIVLTLALFILALIIKGFTHEVLLEAGVFLVSAKLILLSHKSITSAQVTDQRLQQMQNLLQQIVENTGQHNADGD
jgi:hypothetical protein